MRITTTTGGLKVFGESKPKPLSEDDRIEILKAYHEKEKQKIKKEFQEELKDLKSKHEDEIDELMKNKSKLMMIMGVLIVIVISLGYYIFK